MEAKENVLPISFYRELKRPESKLNACHINVDSRLWFVLIDNSPKEN